MRKYETIFILDPALDNNAVEGEINKFNTVILTNAGKILKQDRWGTRNLAYPIAKKTQGYYVFTLLEGTKETLSELDRAFRLDEQVLRHLTILLQKRQLKVLERAKEAAVPV